MHLRLHAREIAGAQVAAEEAQGHGRHGITAGDAESRADHAQAGAFQQHLAQQLSPLHAQHAQQRELAAAADDGQRLRGKHQKGARKQGDEGQHRQVDPVGAAEVIVAAILVFVIRLAHLETPRVSGFQCAREIGLEGVAVDALAQFQIDARQLAQLVEAPLRRADIHHGDALAGARALQRTGHAQRHLARTRLQGNRVALRHTEPAQGGRR